MRSCPTTSSSSCNILTLASNNVAIIILLVNLNPAVKGEIAAPNNPAPIPWKNPLIPLLFASSYGLIKIPAKPFPISIIPFLTPKYIPVKTLEGSLSNKSSVFFIPCNSSHEVNKVPEIFPIKSKLLVIRVVRNLPKPFAIASPNPKGPCMRPFLGASNISINPNGFAYISYNNFDSATKCLNQMKVDPISFPGLPSPTISFILIT